MPETLDIDERGLSVPPELREFEYVGRERPVEQEATA